MILTPRSLLQRNESQIVLLPRKARSRKARTAKKTLQSHLRRKGSKTVIKTKRSE